MKKVLWMAAWLFLSGCGTTLQGGLSEREANEIILVLAEAGIEGEKKGQGSEWAVEVSGSDLSTAFRVLSAAGLPRPKHTGFLGVYKERGLVPGRMEERALFLSALQEEISQTLESVEGIVSARVHVTVKPDKKLYKSEAPPPTASVLIGYLPGPDAQPPISGDAVKKIVAHAVVGLERERVVVVFSPKRKATVPAGANQTVSPNGVLRIAAVGVASLAFLVSAFFVLRKRKKKEIVPLRARRMA